MEKEICKKMGKKSLVDVKTDKRLKKKSSLMDLDTSSDDDDDSVTKTTAKPSKSKSPIQEEYESGDNDFCFIEPDEESDIEAHPSDSPGTSRTNTKRKRGSTTAEKALNKKAKATESLECETCGQVLKTVCGVCGKCNKNFNFNKIKNSF